MRRRGRGGGPFRRGRKARGQLGRLSRLLDRLRHRLEARADAGGGGRQAALAAAAAAMAAADPQAAMTLDVDCPGCGAAVSTAWDVAPFFWAELHAWALRVLREVHTLAAAYGWTEATTLNLSAHRRRLYLQMVSG